MRASAWALLTTAPSKAKLTRISSTSSRRSLHRSDRRALHTSLGRKGPDGGSRAPEDESKSSTEPVISSEDLSSPQLLISDGSDNGFDNGSEPSKPKDPNNYGSAARRARRNKLPKELPAVHIPQWFMTRNITLFEESKTQNLESPVLSPVLPDATNSNALLQQPHQASQVTKPDRVQNINTEPDAETLEFARNLKIGHLGLQTYESVLFEIATMIRAGLRLPQSNLVDTTSNKTHLVLCCPKQGATRYLRDLILNCWDLSRRGIDFIRLDAHDVAEIGGSYMDEPGRLQPNTMSSLSYDVSTAYGQGMHRSVEEQVEDEEADEEGDEEVGPASGASPQDFSPSSRRGVIDVSMGIIPIGSVAGNVQEALKHFGASGPFATSKSFTLKTPRESNDSQDLKLGLFVETLLATREMKRQTRLGLNSANTSLQVLSDPSQTSSLAPRIPFDPSQRSSRDLVVIVEDYPQINMTTHGQRFLDKLHEIVDAKRRDGQEILIIGTASEKGLLPMTSRAGIKQAQTEPIGGPTRTVIVPVKEIESDQILSVEHGRKVRATNLRHMRIMLGRLAPIPQQVQSVVENWDLDLDHKASFLVDTDDSVWSVDFVDRLTTLSLGLKPSSEEIKTHHIESAMQIICDSDEQKDTWVKGEQDLDKTRRTKKQVGSDSGESLRKLRQRCNRHEKKLLNGVVDAANIKTTFADVRAPAETIEALKTLTTLSLIRPDAFAYGVLATDRIPGLLLYGPPGTGKTLLAKAVAKESGATVLEVSGSDVYDMYVGEGEKNVRAIFSLAKKLAPCVVFIDEADAILGSRGGPSSRNSHRELINQFLREWDGMTDFNAFIMVATNRPFDLDEASLRRLPRRLLVDLPAEADREEILRIHLKDEQLDPEVSLSKLASETPFYSGSDLKNLCVAAALACVREEMDAAAAFDASAQGDTTHERKFQYAEKRTLASRHFKKATEEISASISEDMRSLSAIRKFDEKYGDRRGRRKKLSSYGFKTVNDNEKRGSDIARVRNR